MTCSTSRIEPVLLLAGIARTFSRSSGIAAAAAGTPSSLRKSRRSTVPMAVPLRSVRGPESCGDAISAYGAETATHREIFRERNVAATGPSVEGRSRPKTQQSTRGGDDLLLRQQHVRGRRPERDEA